MIRKLAIAIVTVGSLGASAVELPLPQGDQVFTFKISSGDISCTDRVQHPHFPTPTILRIRTSYGTSALKYPSRLVIANTDSVSLWTGQKSCADFRNILHRPKSDLISGRGVQTYSSFVGKNVSGTCLASVREELTLEVGGHLFQGAGSFTVNGLAPEVCETNP